MKNKRLISFLLPLTLSAVCLAGCNDNATFEAKTVKVYLGSILQAFDQKLYFSSSQSGIPYIDLNDGVTFLSTLFQNPSDKLFKLTGQKDNGSYKFSRENGSYLVFNLKNNTVFTNNLSKLSVQGFARSSFDIRGQNDCFYDEKGEKIEGQVRFNTVKNERQVFETAPLEITMDLDDYNIKTYRRDDKYLVPFTTFYDIAGPSTCGVLFNGENLFVTSMNSMVGTYANMFYSKKDQKRSKALIEYNYNEFCRNLDYNYGLKAEHGINSDFDTYFSNNGLKTLLTSENRLDVATALYQLQYGNFADSHSGYLFANPYEGGPLSDDETAEVFEKVHMNPGLIQRALKGENTKIERIAHSNISIADGSVIEPVFQTGDTLFVTFDHFNMNDTNNADFYYTNDTFRKDKKTYIKSHKNDVPAVVSYANDLILQDINSDKPTINNVVVDLSGNVGGSIDAAIFILGWLDSAQLNLYNPITTGKGSICYTSDINFDKKIDNEDQILFANEQTKLEYISAGKKVYQGKVYCLTSESSFSCGNYVPAMLKQSQLATLVGTKSGGGACVVHMGGNADGSGFCFSGNNVLCEVINGSFYNIDKGVDPDIYLDDTTVMYGGNTEKGYSDRQNLINFLKKF